MTVMSGGGERLCQRDPPARPQAAVPTVSPTPHPWQRGGRDPHTCSQPLHAWDVVAEPARRDSVCPDPPVTTPHIGWHVGLHLPQPGLVMGPGALPHSPLHPLFGGLAFELPCLPLLEFGWSLPGGGGSPCHPGGRFDLRLGGLQAHGRARADSRPRVAVVPLCPVLAQDGSSHLVEGRHGGSLASSPARGTLCPDSLPVLPWGPSAIADQLSRPTLPTTLT